MPALNNIWQGVRKLSFKDRQTFCCIWNKDHDFGNFEEPCAEGSCLKQNLKSITGRVYLI